jgi:hypothetical protein
LFAVSLLIFDEPLFDNRNDGIEFMSRLRLFERVPLGSGRLERLGDRMPRVSESASNVAFGVSIDENHPSNEFVFFHGEHL